MCQSFLPFAQVPPKYIYQCDAVVVDPPLPLPCQGPKVKILDHREHLSDVKEITDCSACGENLAAYLFHDLKLGQSSPQSQNSFLHSFQKRFYTMRRQSTYSSTHKRIHFIFFVLPSRRKNTNKNIIKQILLFRL